MPGLGRGNSPTEECTGQEWNQVDVVRATYTFLVQRRRLSEVARAVVHAGETSLRIAQAPGVPRLMQEVDRLTVVDRRLVELPLGERDISERVKRHRTLSIVKRGGGTADEEAMRLVEQICGTVKFPSPVGHKRSVV